MIGLAIIKQQPTSNSMSQCQQIIQDKVILNNNIVLYEFRQKILGRLIRQGKRRGYNEILCTIPTKNAIIVLP